MAYSFEYTIIVPTTAGGSTGGNFVFQTVQTPAGGPFQITGLSGDFDGSPINGFGTGELGLNSNTYDAIGTGGVTFTTVAGETVTISDANGQLAVQATGPTPINAVAVGISFNTNAPACFLRGTLIATGRGEAPVESLEIGDTVLTGSGALRPIKWIGRRSYSGRLAAITASLQPVRIRAGALGEHLPRRDLLVSAKHAILIDGCLVAAEDLIDGVSVVREAGMDDIGYTHIELETHDVIVAEGALSETYVDDDNRAIFHNAEDYSARYPDEAKRAAEYCAPRIADGYQLDAIRVRLAGGVKRAA